MSRHINFQFMNRQLLWEHFTQLALCVVPLVDWDGLRRQVSGLIRQRRLMYVYVRGGGCRGGVHGRDGGGMARGVERKKRTDGPMETGGFSPLFSLSINQPVITRPVFTDRHNPPLPFPPTHTHTRTHRGGSEEGGGVPGAGGADGDMACVVCGEEEAHTPYVTDCGHIFCYYCLKLGCIQDDQFACPRCVRVWVGGYMGVVGWWGVCWGKTEVGGVCDAGCLSE
jgi:hypothetical protein